MKIAEKLASLRELMKERNLSAYIIPSSDAHQSEYVAEYFKARQWVSGFTGSAGTVVVTLKDAGLWTDGRYYIQAEKQLANSGIKLFKAADIGVPSFSEWLGSTLDEGDCVGFNGKIIDLKTTRDMEKSFKSKHIKINFEYDLIDLLWKNRPAIPKDMIFVHDVSFAGKSRVEKLQEVRETLKKNDVNSFLLTSLDDIAWLLNIRGADVPNNPVIICHVLLTMNKCFLCINEEKVPENVKIELLNDGITVISYEKIGEKLLELGKEHTIVFDPSKTSVSLYNAIGTDVKRVEDINITTRLKAVKNETELENLRNCMINDGIALVKLIKWVKENVDKESITEVTIDERLLAFRKEQQFFVSPSFDNIVGYKENAAMMHYKATLDSTKTLEKEGFLLIDSGGQYYNGTTDTTRTIALGKLTDEEKFDFTLVLKGVIALSSVKFLYGATGSNLDVLARQPLWQQGIDYKCGTGHGVGFFLNVHEGPQRFAIAQNDVKMEKNMIITNEPGVYKEGRHGIRTENILIVKQAERTEFGQFMCFEDVTLCPIDLEGIIPEMLSDSDKTWLNRYHKKVYNLLSPRLNEDEKEWLKIETREI